MSYWKPLKNFQETYEINRCGEIRRIPGFWCHSFRLLKKHMGNSGYYRVSISFNGLTKKFLIHRLVYETFLGQIPKNKTVNHKNGIKTDNRVCNLELCSRSEQMIHAYKNGLQNVQRGEDRKNVSKLTEEQVIEIRQRYKLGETTGKELGKKYAVSAACIWKIIRRDSWSHI